MATRSFFTVSKEDHDSETTCDAVIKGKDKVVMGGAWYKEAPSGRTYLVQKLQGYWIITDEEKKLFDKLKKEHGKV